jgi:hypothetical protein
MRRLCQYWTTTSAAKFLNDQWADIAYLVGDPDAADMLADHFAPAMLLALQGLSPDPDEFTREYPIPATLPNGECDTEYLDELFPVEFAGIPGVPDVVLENLSEDERLDYVRRCAGDLLALTAPDPKPAPTVVPAVLVALAPVQHGPATEATDPPQEHPRLRLVESLVQAPHGPTGARVALAA